MLRKSTRTLQQKLIFFAGFALMMLSVGVVAAPTVYAADCGPNAVMYCGFSSASDFIKKLRANNDRNGKDLQKIFKHFGLTSGDYDRFADTAKSGTVYKDGRVVVGGQTVVKNANSLGRTKLNGRHNKSLDIGSDTYYYGLTSRVFLSNSIPAKVMFNSNGEAELVVLTDCGNPVWGDKVKSGAQCNLLTKDPVSGSKDTFKFTTTATASGNAKITKYVYDFGDGTPTRTTTSKSITHQYKTPGTYKAKVTVYASVPGGNTITSTSTECETTVVIEELVVPECVQLTAPKPDGLTFTFTATAKFGKNTTFTGADFTFGDGKSVSNVKPTTPTTVVVQHTYDKAGTYSASAVLHFNVDGKPVTANACKTTVTPEGGTPECKPGIPVGDPRCEVCPYDPSLTPDDPNCKETPTELPNTGAGNIIAIGGVALVAGFLFYRRRNFLRHKLAFRQAQQGTSVLPLADPLSPDDPLADTPLAPQAEQPVRSTLRRRRQF